MNFPPANPAGLDTTAFTNAFAAQQTNQPAQHTQPGSGHSPSPSGAAAGFSYPQAAPTLPPATQPLLGDTAFAGASYQPQFQPPPQPQPQFQPQYQPPQQPQGPQWPTPVNPSVPPQQQVPTQFPSQPQFDVSTELSRWGIDSRLSPDAQIRALSAKLQQITPYAQFGQQLASQQSSAQPPATAAATTAAAAAPEEFDVEKYFQDAWGAPKWQQQYDLAIQQGMVERDPQTGLFRPTPGYEAMTIGIINGLNEAMQFQTSNVQKIFRDNPYRQFYDVMREPIRREIQREAGQLVQGELQRIKTTEFIDKFQAENSDWLFSVDAMGRKVYTPAGESFLRQAEQFVDDGMDVQRAVDVAARFIKPQIRQNAPQQPQPQQQYAPPQQQAPPTFYMQPHAIPMQVAPQNPYAPQPLTPEMASAAQQQSFLQNAMQRSSYTPGTVVAPGAAPPGPANMTAEGLENLFTMAAAQYLPA